MVVGAFWKNQAALVVAGEVHQILMVVVVVVQLLEQ